MNIRSHRCFLFSKEELRLNPRSLGSFLLSVPLLVSLCLCGERSYGKVGAADPSCSLRPETDWSVAVVESTIKRYPTAESLKGWGYAKSLYLYGVYLVYLRTKDRRYLDYIKSWVDLHVDDKGAINRPID